ncbi:MAG: ECF transporter S component [Candidatus Eremiobacteraeota bacterium]|nr:ECF transporter S component [Candidatus Eremiobacteraeota bacterium]MCW5870670.1 ECF transporter S component [Candidatus Eremiobacteraeota bacterium]
MRLSLLIKISLLSALAAVLMQLQIPIFPAHSYLTYDASEVPALVASFALGPAAGMAVVVLKDILHGLAHFRPTELVGLPINAIAGCTLAGVAGAVYRVRRKKSVALVALALAVVSMTLVMIPCNLVLLPLFQRLFFPNSTPAQPDQVLQLLLTVFIPFNLIKGSITSVLTFLVYKRVSPTLKSVPRWDVGLSGISES